MVNVREYLKNKSADRDEFDRKILTHKRKIRFTVLSLIILAVLVVLALRVYFTNRVFDGYTVKSTIETSGENSAFFKYAEGLLVYSDDGIAYMKGETTVWNQAFEMKNPVVDICESTVAIADLETSTVYIYNAEGRIGKVETIYPIISLEVSAQGVVAAITQDSDTNRIEVLDYEGNMIAVGQSYVTGDGCPLDISLSNDGTKLVVSYIYIDGGEAKSKVIFYNYSEVGKNEVGRIVGGFDHYASTIISRVEFLDNETVVAVGDDTITFYSISQKPSMVKEFALESPVRSILFDEKYVCLIFETDDYENPYKITLYDSDGDKKVSYSTDFLYTGAEIGEESFVLYNSLQMRMYSLTGKLRFDGSIEEGITKIITTDKANQYYVINDEKNIMNTKLN